MKKLEVGNAVYASGPELNSPIRVLKVVRTTKTLAELNNRVRLSRDPRRDGSFKPYGKRRPHVYRLVADNVEFVNERLFAQKISRKYDSLLNDLSNVKDYKKKAEILKACKHLLPCK